MVGTKIVFSGAHSGDAALIADLINRERVTVSLGVPTVFQSLLAYLLETGKRLPSLSHIQIGGASCPLSLSKGFEALGVWATVGWGMTETSPLGASNCIPRASDESESSYDERRIKAGRPVFGIEMKIVDEQGDELPWNGHSSGALKIRGPWVASQYYGAGRERAAQGERWFDTGDVATIGPDGTMNITDRLKDLIKSGGEWINSQDIERAVLDHPQVSQAAVVGVAHPQWGERPLLLAVTSPDALLQERELLQSLEGKIARWWTPDACIFLDDLPLTAMGKLDKKLLRDRFATSYSPA
jgi:fatty-acyl-CoA synthase